MDGVCCFQNQAMGTDNRSFMQGHEARLKKLLPGSMIGGMQHIRKSEQSGRHATGVQEKAYLKGSGHGLK